MACVLPVATERNFPKLIVGDFTFARFHSLHRQPLFLARNIRQVLVHHQDKLSCDTSSDLGPRPQQSTPAATNELPPVDALEDPAKAVVEAASHKALVIRTMEPDFETRRSTRRLQEAAHHNDNAELTLDLVSIRKKLNFKTNRVTEDARYRKKSKSGHMKCLATLTIWDNRASGDQDPLVKSHVDCTLVTFETEDRIPNVNIQLDEPFRLRAKDLKVSACQESGETSLRIIDDYFLELKLIPTIKSEAEWPPIPVLGKSDGDSQRGLTTWSEKLKGALLARYQKLPQAPEANVPLSIFFIHEGQLHKTKFGMEINAQWSVSNNAKIEDYEVAAKLPGRSWMVDSSGSLFGREKIELANRTKGPSSPPPRQNDVVIPPAEVARPRVTVSYLVDPDSARTQDIDKELRSMEIEDFGCPLCVGFTAKDVMELRFHLLMMHPKYNFILYESKDLADSSKFLFHIKPIQSGKQSRRSASEVEFSYVARRAPFDVSAFLDGDRSWTGETRPRQRQQPAAPVKALVADPQMALRKQNGGFLAPQDVRDFAKPQRKKRRVVQLDRKTGDRRTTPYSSISHRPRSVSEEPMSETDDDMDDTWFIERHLETLEIRARKELWTDLKAEVLKRWDRHRLEERLEHTRYLSDSLVRFVRKEKQLLQNPDAQPTVSELLSDLVENGFITPQFRAEIKAMIYDTDKEGPLRKPDEAMADAPAPEKNKPPAILNPKVLEQKATASGQASLTVNVWKKHVLALPKTSCGVCTKPILLPHKEEIHCANHECPAAGTIFHLKCVRERRCDKRSWTCHGCKALAKTDIKGKGKAVD